MSAANDAAIQRLTTALALGDGFQFHIVVCHSPRQVRNLIATLTQTVSARRGGSLRTEHLHPDSLRQRDQALDGDALTAYVTQALGGLARPAADERQLIVLDASFARQSDTPAWSLLFRRLNEQRNALAHALDAALLLCLTPHLEPIFAHEAPDFWSVRGVSVRLEPVIEEDHDLRLSVIRSLRGQLQPASMPLDNLSGVDDAEVERLKAELPTLREQAKSVPDDIAKLEHLSIVLSRLGSRLIKRGSHRDALEIGRELVEIVERLAHLMPDDLRLQSVLIKVLLATGSQFQALDELSEAITFAKRALAVARHLVAVAPDPPDHRRFLTTALSQFGDLAMQLGDDEGALIALREAVALGEDLAHVAPEQSEDKKELAIIYGGMGAVLASRQQYDDAQGFLEKALMIHAHFATLEPSRIDHQRNLAKANQRLGSLFIEAGQPVHAREYLERALAISKRLHELDPSSTDLLWDQVMLALRFAQIEPDHRVEHLRRAFELLTDIQSREDTADGFDALMVDLQQAIQARQSPPEV